MALSRRKQALSTVTAAVSLMFFLSVALVAHHRFSPTLESLLVDPALDLRRAEQEREQEQEQEQPQEQEQEQEGALLLSVRPENAARALINSIRDTAREVAEALGVDPDDGVAPEELDEWNHLNPCRSRTTFSPMYEYRTNSEKIQPNPLWNELLSEYTKLHRLCTVSITNITDHFLTGRGTTGCHFAISNVGSGVKAVGEKFLVNASILLYAILTKRVLLVASTSFITECTCEPFVGSSWILDAGQFPLGEFSLKPHDRSWVLGSTFFERMDKYVKGANLGEQRSSSASSAWKEVHAVHMVYADSGASSRFFCQTEQHFLTEVTWLQFSSHLFSISNLFAAPPFRSTLEAFFPDRMAAPHLLRSTHLPSDPVWERALPVHDAYVESGDKTVGIQLSSSWEQSNRAKDLLNQRILDCTRQNSILPAVKHNTGLSFAKHSTIPIKFKRKPVITVYIASSAPKLLSHLSKHFMRRSTITGVQVAIVQISNSGSEQRKESTVEEDQKALAEIILLSFSDQLLVTPGSPFGSLAQAYGGQTPWLVEMAEDGNLPPCKRGQAAGFCIIASDQSHKCPHEPASNGTSVLDGIQHGEDCILRGLATRG